MAVDVSGATAKCLVTLKKCQEMEDPESAHGFADDAIEEFLGDIGFSDIAYEYSQVEKWYS